MDADIADDVLICQYEDRFETALAPEAAAGLVNLARRLMRDPRVDGLAQAAYILATVKHETDGRFVPVEEAYWLSERWRQRNLPYYPYHGRGYVQITWQANYLRAGRTLGIPLEAQPALALEPQTAYVLLVRGMLEGWYGRPLSDFVTADTADFYHARRSVNGLDRAHMIARYADEFMEILEDAIQEPPRVPQPTRRNPFLRLKDWVLTTVL
ncbi:MAG: hypothetical protein J7D61_07865 [Marichromatium sp.]|nr:hypothetical protein [Marichromatium sp.]